MPIAPGVVSPRRAIPRGISVPDYVGRRAPRPYRGSHTNPPEIIERMRRAGEIAADTLIAAGNLVQPGVTTDAIDALVHDRLCAAGAYPSPLGYRGYPKSVCTSVNEVICHGIPDSTVLSEGDIINVDVTAYLDGVHGDTSATFLVGEVAPDIRALVERTEEATRRAIAAVAPGRPLNVIGRVIESYARRFGYGVVRDFTGHGIGTAFHTGLIVHHYDTGDSEEGRPAVLLEPGMTFTIEPMITLGTADFTIWDDDWTVVTADRLASAQFEHTVAVTEDGAKILTLPTPPLTAHALPRADTGSEALR